MNIQWGEPVQLIRLKKSKFAPSELHYNHLWDIDCFPVSAKYDDYGYFEDIEIKPVNRIFDEIDGENTETPYMAVHKSVYDKFSQTLFNKDDTIVGTAWDGTGSVPADETYWTRRIKQAHERFEQQGKFFEKLKELKNSDDADAYNSAREMYGDDLFELMHDTFRGMPFWPTGEAYRQDPTYFLEPTLPREVTLLNTFIANISILNKKLKTSVYASQEDSIHIYSEMTKAMNAVLKEKRVRHRKNY